METGIDERRPVRPWVLVVGVGVLAVGVAGIGAINAATTTGLAFSDPPGCLIVYDDGTAYVGGLTKAELLEADKEVRRLRAPGGWLISLQLPAPPDIRTHLRYRMLEPATDPASVAAAVRECIVQSRDL